MEPVSAPRPSSPPIGPQNDQPVAQLIEGPRITLAAVRPEHTERLRQIRAEPEVFAWWGPIDPDFPFDEDDDTPGFVVLHEGRIAGFVQFHEENDAMYRHAGIDLFLSAAVHGRGLGQETVAVLAAYLIDVRGHHRLVIDPCSENVRAIACYTAAGFAPIGLMRQYERSPAGVWRDGLLMDLLAADLVRP